MNNLSGHIKEVEVSGDISLVTVGMIGEIQLKAIVIDTPNTVPYLKADQKLNVLFKETEVVIGIRKEAGISLQNRIPGNVVKVERGKFLSSLEIESTAGIIRSIISTAAVEELKLKTGMAVFAMVKLNEIMLSLP
jgi:molybdopterin-binding protein